MKIILIICILSSLGLGLSGCGNNNNLENNANNVKFSKTNTESPNNIINNSSENNVENNEIINNQNKDNNSNQNISSNENTSNEETELAKFSTPLKSGLPARITNIKITCNKINGYVLKNGETFSFNQLIGPCTAEEGYKKAEIYVNKKIKYALGGGNCQVSTTLYNAALAVSGITIIERHEHGKSVDYIEHGKDATVSYNTLDLKFRNDTGYDIKLYASCDDVNVYARITR